MLNNDIVGGDTTPGETMQDKTAVRVFSEGVPGTATLDDLRRIQTVGAESDSPSRELARAVDRRSRATYFKPGELHAPRSAAPARRAATRCVMMPPFHPVLEFRRDRYLRGGDHTSFNLEGFPAVRFTEWRENFAHQHQNVRTAEGKLPNGSTGQVQYGDLIQFVDTAYVANVARLNAATLATLALRARAAAERQGADQQSGQQHPAPVGARRPAFPPAPRTRSSGATPARPTWQHAQDGGTANLHHAAHLEGQRDLRGPQRGCRAGHRSVAVYPWPTAAASFPTPPASRAK